ncbi:MAG: class B sortase [Defluviitaleaceae bacterium]|nr:class B sortase [Defluviitaleaceae bacterium]
MAKRKNIIKPILPYDPLADNHEKNPPAPEAVPPKRKGHKNYIPTFFIVGLAIVTTVSTLAFFAFAYRHIRELNEARQGYNTLREIAEQTMDIGGGVYPVFYTPHVSAFDGMMLDINPDFVCWIRIEGTRIDYPVVRAENNERYLNIMFTGEDNEHGAVFMDYRNAGDFVPHIIIYGHNSRYGNMFSDLRRFLDGEFLLRYPTISLIVNDRLVEYDIFSAKKTDITDPAFFLDFNEAGSFHDFLERIGAPPDAAQIITLSTCVSAGNDDERVIVQGVLRR